MKTLKRFCLAISLMSLIAVLFTSSAFAQATVTTDRPDYSPGDIVIVQGTGWQPGETVSLVFVETPYIHPPETLYTVASASGEIYNSEYVIQNHDLGQNFTLTATGDSSGLTAQTTFTDAAPLTCTITGPSPVCSGTTNPYSVTRDGGTGQAGTPEFSWSLSGSGTLSATTGASVNVAAGASGSYTLTVIARRGLESSTCIKTATINVAPSITSQPSNQTLCAPSSASFSVSATGTGVTYQWRKGGVNLSNGGNISGATSATLTINPTSASDAGSYDVVVSGAAPCSPVTSTSATLTVNTSPSITTNPSSQTKCEGQSVTFAVTATGTSLTYQWRKNTVNISGATSSSYTIASVVTGDAGSYDVMVSGTCSPSATSSAATLTVNPVPAAPSASNNGPICAGQTLNLSASTVAGATYSWTGPNGFTSSSQNPSILNATTAASGTYSVTVTVSGCTSLPATTTATVNAVPSAPTVSSNSPICEGATLNLTGSTISGVTYSWTGPNGFTASTQNPSISNATTAASGVYIVTVTNSSGCTASASTTATVNAKPACSITGPDAVCAGSSGSYTAPSGAGLSYNWTSSNQTNFTVRPATKTDQTAVVDAGAAGTYTLTLTVTNASGCSSTCTKIVTVDAAPTAANAGPDQSLCTATATLAGNTPLVGTGSWSLVSGTGTITNASSPTSGVTGLVVGSSTFRWTITNGVCAPSTDDVVITRNAEPTTANAGFDQTVCATSATLAGNTPTVGTGTWTLVSGTGTITTPSSPTSTVTGLGVGANTFRWTISNDACIPSTDEVTIFRDAQPTAANAGPDQQICATTATLAGNTPVVGTGTWTLVSGSGSITTPSSPSSGVTGLGAGNNVFRWTISNGVCAPSSDDVTILRYEEPTLANAGEDQTVCVNSATLGGNTPTIGTGAWTLVSGSGTITNPSSPTSGVTGLGLGNNVFRWTISNGVCTPSTDEVTITRNDPPSVSALSNITVNADANDCGAIVGFAGASATGLPAPTISYSQASGTRFPVGTTTVTVTATNSCGSAQSTFTITVLDAQAPSISGCPSNITVYTGAGRTTCDQTASWTAPTATDNCAVTSFTTNYSSGATFPVGTTTVTYTAKDAANNTSTCSFTVTVIDNTPPQITCQANLQLSNDPGKCESKGGLFNDGTIQSPFTSDNCPGAIGLLITRSDRLDRPRESTGFLNGAYPIGMTTITWYATDAAGNVDSCFQTITVIDNENPSIACVSNQSKNTNAGVCTYTAVGTEFDPTSYGDNCPGATISYALSGATSGTGTSLAGVVFNKGTTTVTWTVTDASGHTATCSFDVTVIDNENPTIACVSNQSKNTNAGVCTYTAVGTEFNPTAFGDNCPGATISNNYNSSSTLAGAVFPKGTTTVTWTVTDASGHTASCSFDVVVSDNENPTISCVSSPQNRNTNPGVCTYTAVGTEFNPTAFGDNCPGATISNNYNSSTSLAGAVFQKATTTVIWTVTDASGHTASCSFDVVVSDNENPVISGCPANITVYTGPGRTTCDQVATWTAPTASDNCAVTSFTSTRIPGATFPVGTTTVTYTAKDAANNTTTCPFTVTVIDNTPPTFTAPAAITIYKDANCSYNANPSITGDVTDEADNCDNTLNATYTDAVAAGSCQGEEIITRTWSLTDDCGNTTTHTQTITVKDNTPPSIICPADILVLTPGPGQPSFQSVTVNVADNCSGPLTMSVSATSTIPPAPGLSGPSSISLSSGSPSGFSGSGVYTATFPIGVTIVTFTATDPCGNTSSCQVKVTVPACVTEVTAEGNFVTKASTTTAKKVPIQGAKVRMLAKSSVQTSTNPNGCQNLLDATCVLSKIGSGISDPDGPFPTTINGKVMAYSTVPDPNGWAIYLDLTGGTPVGVTGTGSITQGTLKIAVANSDCALQKQFNVILVGGSTATTSMTQRQQQIKGSILEITYPDAVEWDGTQFVYPFIFWSDSDWEVDVCANVPEGYRILGKPCMQFFVANETKVIFFDVEDIGSPEPKLEIRGRVKHNGKFTRFDTDIPGVRKGKKAHGKAVSDGLAGLAVESAFIPTEYALFQNYPDPFNPSTTLQFDLPEPAVVSLKVYNMLGQEVAAIVDNAAYNAGRYQVTFNASHLSSGVYIYRITAGSYINTKKMLLLK